MLIPVRVEKKIAVDIVDVAHEKKRKKRRKSLKHSVGGSRLNEASLRIIINIHSE